MKTFKTEDDLLKYFEDGGDLLDVENNIVYIADIGGEDDRFYGIMVADNIPTEKCRSVTDACQWALGCVPAPGSGAANRMDFMEAPGGWFSEFCEDVLSNPHAFLGRRD